jgi:hypothetical protein
MTPSALAKVRERATRWHGPGFGSPHEIYSLTSTPDGVTVVASVGVQESLDADPRECLWLVAPEAHRELDPGAIGQLVKSKFLIDGRNMLDRDKWRSAGWRVHALGRTD